MSCAKGSTWTATIDIRKKDGIVTCVREEVAFTDVLCDPFNILSNLCMQEKALSAIV